MIRMTAVTNRDSANCKTPAPASSHRAEADRQIDDALVRIASDTQAQVYIEDPQDGAEGYWSRVPTWSGADLSMARIVAEVALRHPGITVTAIQSSDLRYPLSQESGLVLSLWPNGYLCYTEGDRLSFRTGYDGNFPGHLRGTVSTTVGDYIQGAFAALMPRLDALREWGEERVRERAKKRAAEDAEREARKADGRALAEEIARLIIAEDPLSLAEAVNAAVRGMSRGGVERATMEAGRVAFMRDMTGMPPMAMGMPVNPRDWKRGSRSLAWRQESAEGGRD